MKYRLVKQDYKMKLDNVGGAAVDSEDNVYLAVRGPSTPIVVFDKEGRFIKAIGTDVGVKNSHGICIDADDNIFLADCSRHVIHKFAKSGELLMTIGKLDTPAADTGAINGDYKTVKQGGSPFYSPSKIAVSKIGDIYVADGYGNARVHHFSKEGKLIKSWGQPGTGKGEFNIPHGIGIDNDTEDIYICDRENLRIQIFDSEGNLKDIWENIYRPTDICIRGDYVYVSELGELLFTDNILYDPALHRHHSQVRIFDKQGHEAAQIGTEDGGRPGSFLAAHGLCVDSCGDIYVCEVNNWSLQDAFAAWPNGIGAPTCVHPAFQKFAKIY